MNVYVYVFMFMLCYRYLTEILPNLQIYQLMDTHGSNLES